MLKGSIWMFLMSDVVKTYCIAVIALIALVLRVSFWSTNTSDKCITNCCLTRTCSTFFFLQECLQRSFKAEVYTCPACRHDLGKNYSMSVNKSLQDILNQFFPGYSNGRWSLVLLTQPSRKWDVNCKGRFQ